MDTLNSQAGGGLISFQSEPEGAVTFSYSDIQQHLASLISEWESGGSIPDDQTANPAVSIRGEQTLCRLRRELRRDQTDVNQKRASQELAADENYIPQLLIDKHIAEEKPAQIAFIEQPDRMLVFKDLTDPLQSTEDLEEEFTNHMRYEGWTIPWHRAFDGCDLHGGACLEVCLDESKPFYTRIEAIRREDLIFPKEATDLQSCEYIMRRYFYMPWELESFVQKYNWDPESVKTLTKDKTSRHKRIGVYKVFHKRDGIVYIFWYHQGCKTFIKAPEVLPSGIYDAEEILAFQQQVAAIQQDPTIPREAIPQVVAQIAPTSKPATTYPVFFLPYEVIEDDRLLASKGLAYRDKADQEAITQLWTSIINAANRAADVYASFKQDPTGQVGLSDSQPIKRNTINQRQVEWWSFPMPDAALLGVVTNYSSVVAAKSSRVDFAVNNRDDSRKTATEIQAASKQTASLVSVNLSGQSFTVLKVYELCWEIGRSHVLLGKIPTFTIPPERLLHTYRLGAAGDVDIRKREDKKQVIRETFQYLVGTPIGNKFLVYLIQTFFPEHAKEWIPILEAGDPSQIIAIAIQLFEAILADPQISAAMSPEDSIKLQNIINQMKTYVGAPGTQPATAGSGVSNSAQPVAGAPNNEVTNNLPKEQVGAASGASGAE